MNLIKRTNNIWIYVFIAEMGIKLIALNPIGYIKEPMNCFDGSIVALTIFDLGKIFKKSCQLWG